ncbi:MAG: sterol desaturase family protein [Bdellovibrionota bacterium]
MEIKYKFIGQVILLAVLFSLEWLLPYFANSHHKFRHAARNLTLAFINGLVGTLVFSSLIISSINYSSAKGYGILNSFELANLRIVLALVLFDLWMYLWHRMNHRVKFLWKFHRMHHSDSEMDVTTGLRFHPGEIILSFCARLIIIPLIGINFSELIVYEVLLQFIVLFHHSNISINKSIDKVFKLVFVSPHMHKVHHSDIQTETDSNYSSVFSVWDRVFGSLNNREDTENISFGLKEFNKDSDQEVVGMLKTPFKSP